jgi:hypothetical protein
MERAMMYAGVVLGGGPANQYDTIEAALAALVSDREQGEQADRGSMSRTASAELPPERRPSQFPSWRPPK